MLGCLDCTKVKLQDGQASMEKDKDSILKSMGADPISGEFDRTVMDENIQVRVGR